MKLSFETTLPESAAKSFDWHERPGAFERLNPPWEPVKVLSHVGGIRDGARVTVGIPVGPFYLPWYLGHKDYIHGKQFCDFQVRGPFLEWNHIHSFLEVSENSSRLVDALSFRLPARGFILGERVMEKKLTKLFRYRHAITRNDLAVHANYSFPAPLKILISGASGFIGSALGAFLSTGGHSVSRLVRSTPTREGDIPWDPSRGILDPKAIDGFDVIINLSGDSVFGRWGERKKLSIQESRLQTSRLLVETILKVPRKPRVVLSASAIGFYGDTGKKVADETGPKGEGFLADITEAWEQAWLPLTSCGTRVVHPRIGIVLSPQGGALKQMLPPFRFGVGGPLGDGRAITSWIALDDILYGMLHCIHSQAVSGPVNFVSPHAETNGDFSKKLASHLGRPCLFPVPHLALQALFGEFANEALLKSIHVSPAQLLSSGYQFRFPHIEEAFQHFL